MRKEVEEERIYSYPQPLFFVRKRDLFSSANRPYPTFAHCPVFYPWCAALYAVSCLANLAVERRRVRTCSAKPTNLVCSVALLAQTCRAWRSCPHTHRFSARRGHGRRRWRRGTVMARQKDPRGCCRKGPKTPQWICDQCHRKQFVTPAAGKCHYCHHQSGQHLKVPLLPPPVRATRQAGRRACRFSGKYPA